ncbi:hypothetical protein GFL93_09225 [Rhizobium leguminosarum bv. viciae]|uniref:hypothetical protein n=1 Tax=Rhizobium TaxID=379 RepID=UPI00144240A5|nr:hypothetical protein [Rhizobium leguminosarum]NKK06051.1 hypothetical protein [Rhizobium leguminosarum bv. viciae]
MSAEIKEQRKTSLFPIEKQGEFAKNFSCNRAILSGIRMFIFVIIGIICGFIGAMMAKGKNKEPVLWFFICAFTGLIGIIILAMSKAEQTGPVVAITQGGQTSSRVVAMKPEDWKKWQALVDLDPEIAAAAATARARAPECEVILAEKYMTLNDKNYLSAALNKAISELDAKQAAQAEKIASFKVETDDTKSSGTITSQYGVSKFSKSGGSYKITEGALSGYSYLSYDAMLKAFQV